MRFTSWTSVEGVTEHLFSLPGASGEVPGVLWTAGNGEAPRPLIVMGHGGGQHKQAPGITARARRFAAAGLAVVALDAPAHGGRPRTGEHERLVAEVRTRMQAGDEVTPVLAEFHALVARQSVPEWQAAVDAVQHLDHVADGPVGYWGLSLGCALGVPFVAADARVRAAVLGLGGAETSAADAARITVPLEFLVQWDDERVPRPAALALFDAFASPEKTLHGNPGGHAAVPDFETDSALRFFLRHLTPVAGDRGR